MIGFFSRLSFHDRQMKTVNGTNVIILDGGLVGNNLGSTDEI